MFWKKKIAKYTCIAPNYFDLPADEEGESYDLYKEGLAHAYKNEEYTKEEIAEASALISFDLWKGLLWVNAADWVNDKYQKKSIEKLLRPGQFYPNVSAETAAIILTKITPAHFYTEKELVNISKEIKINLMANCVWQEFVHTVFVKGKETLDVYLKL